MKYLLYENNIEAFKSEVAWNNIVKSRIVLEGTALLLEDAEGMKSKYKSIMATIANWFRSMPGKIMKFLSPAKDKITEKLNACTDKIKDYVKNGSARAQEKKWKAISVKFPDYREIATKLSSNDIYESEDKLKEILESCNKPKFIEIKATSNNISKVVEVVKANTKAIALLNSVESSIVKRIRVGESMAKPNDDSTIMEKAYKGCLVIKETVTMAINVLVGLVKIISSQLSLVLSFIDKLMLGNKNKKELFKDRDTRETES